MLCSFGMMCVRVRADYMNIKVDLVGIQAMHGFVGVK